MSALFTDEELAQLGIDADTLGSVERLAAPHPRVDEARGPRPTTLAEPGQASSFETSSRGADTQFEAAALHAIERRTVRSDVLARVGVNAAFDERRFEVLLSADADLEFQLERVDPVAAGLRDASTRAARTPVRLSLLGSFRFVIATPEGSALALVAIDEREVRLQNVYPWPAPPARQWLEAIRDDLLRDLVTKRVAGDRWDQTTMAGVLARLQAEPTGDLARARLAALRAGGDAAPSLAPRLWMRAFSPAQRAAVERVARVSAGRLGDRVAAFLDRLSPKALDLQEHWRALCHERDDLEGVRVLLREAGAGQQLEEALEKADEAGRAVRFSWPPEQRVDDERLRKVSLSNAAAWWGSTDYDVSLL
jgi:hypothetical protein